MDFKTYTAICCKKRIIILKNKVSRTKNTNVISIDKDKEIADLLMLFSPLEVKVIESNTFNSYIMKDNITGCVIANLEVYYSSDNYIFGPIGSYSDKRCKDIISNIIKKIYTLSEKEKLELWKIMDLSN